MDLPLKSLLSSGYFPEELPSPFKTTKMGEYLKKYSTSSSLSFEISKGTQTSKPGIYNLARSGTLRRELAILNPIHFGRLAECIAHNWRKLKQKACSSTISLTSPAIGNGGRAISRKYPLSILPEKRAVLRGHGKFLLNADIARFYPSIYTHSIPWALHGKSKTKSNRSGSLLGNQLDKLLRDCQDGQTNGLPIGPDTSLLFAEILLSNVDQLLTKKHMQGIRYIDDYELIFMSESDASSSLTKLQEALLTYELHLNPRKTSILTLPQRLEDEWLSELRSFRISESTDKQRSHLVRFFDKAFALSTHFPGEGVLKYTIGRLAKIKIAEKNLELTENLVIQCARMEAGALPLALGVMIRNKTTKGTQNETRKTFFIDIIQEHAPLRHSSEVAWSLWGCLIFRFKIPAKCIRSILQMEDSICALLALHAQSLGLTESKEEFVGLERLMKSENLYDRQWLLVYEAAIKEWVSAPKGKNPVDVDPNFNMLKTAGISFYDETTLKQEPEELSGHIAKLIVSYGDVIPDEEPEEDVPDF